MGIGDLGLKISPISNFQSLINYKILIINFKAININDNNY